MLKQQKGKKYLFILLCFFMNMYINAQDCCNAGGDLFGLHINVNQELQTPGSQELDDLKVRWAKTDFPVNRDYRDSIEGPIPGSRVKWLVVINQQHFRDANYSLSRGDNSYLNLREIYNWASDSEELAINWVDRYPNENNSGLWDTPIWEQFALAYADFVYNIVMQNPWIDAIEIFSEVDLSHKDNIHPDHYAIILEAVWSRLQEMGKTRPLVITAGLASGASEGGSYGYFRQVMAATKGTPYDYVGFHPYAHKADGIGIFSPSIDNVIQDLFNIAGRQIWLTEFGIGHNEFSIHSKEVQGQYLYNCYNLFMNMSDVVGAAFWSAWDDRSMGDTIKNPNLAQYGLVEPEDQNLKRPAWDMYRTLADTGISGIDISLNIDSSGSMTSNDPANLRLSAANLLIDSVEECTRIGIVDFDSSAKIIAPLTLIREQSDRDYLSSQLSAIDSFGLTNIKAALDMGYGMLNIASGILLPKAAILLTDGRDGYSPPLSAYTTYYESSSWPIYTIGLGNNVDESLLKGIASQTGGRYYFADNDNILQSIYSELTSILSGNTNLLSTRGLINQSQTLTNTITIEPSIQNVNITVSWPGSRIDMILIDPDGRRISPETALTDRHVEYNEASTYTFYSIENPLAGLWRIQITGSDIPKGGEEFSLVAAAKTSTISNYLSFASNYQQNSVIPISVQLKNKNPYTLQETPLFNEQLETKIIQPDGSATTITLYDDGTHNDSLAADGIYSNNYTLTGQAGTYLIITRYGLRELQKTVQVGPNQSIYIPSNYLEPAVDATVTEEQTSISTVIMGKSTNLNINSIKMTLDGQLIPHIFNSTDQIVSYSPSSPLTAGKHFITVECRTTDGQTIHTSRSFTIKTNTPPTANAGENFEAFTRSTGETQTLVTLNGSGSSDADGDHLTYNWYLHKNGESRLWIGVGPSPTIMLSPGTYSISLEVSDGKAASLPDMVSVHVETAAAPDFEIVPETILRQKPPEHTKVELWLHNPYQKEMVDAAASITLITPEGVLSPVSPIKLLSRNILNYDGVKLVGYFLTEELLSLINGYGTFEIKAEARMKSGRYIIGTGCLSILEYKY